MVAEIPANDSTYYQNELLKIPGINTVEPDVIRSPETLNSGSPDDMDLFDQWAFNRTRVPDAWSLVNSESENNTITVAIIDTGIDGTQEDLSGTIRSDGYDWVENQSIMKDRDGHGTYLAGIVGAITGNGRGTAGTASVSLLPERVGTNESGIYASSSALAVHDAAEKGARIILMGYGGSAQSPAEENAIDFAAKKGCILIAPAGNDASNQGHYPSDCFDVISVGSTGKTDGLSYFSNYGIFVELVAPGEGIVSSWPGNVSQAATGTSPAAALVAGCAALVLQADPALDRDDVRDILSSTARDLGRSGRDIYYGYGLVDVAAAVKKARDQRSTNLKLIKNTNSGKISHTGEENATNTSESQLVEITRSGTLNMSAIEIPLQSGWNFVSLPGLPGSGKTSQDIFRGINTDGHTIWKYDSAKQDWMAMEKETDFIPLEGFLVYSDRMTKIPLVLDSANLHHELNVSQGWNLIGTPGMSGISARQGLFSLSDDWVSLLPFNNTLQSYDPAIILGANGTHTDTRILPAFTSYWIYMNKAGVYRSVS